MSRRPSLIHAALARFDSLKAFGVSRHQLKAEQRQELRDRDLPTSWSHSTGKIHSFGTAETYKRHVLAYCAWARATVGVRRLEELDRRAAELAPRWLAANLAQGKSPYTIQMLRSALRMFHQDRTLGADVAIPRRHREQIRRSRAETAADRRLNQEKYHDLIAFLHATGLRRREVTMLRVGQVEDLGWLGIHVQVPNGKGGKARDVVVLPGAADLVRTLVKDKKPTEKLFPRIPTVLDVHACRRSYAQTLYQALSGRELPPATGRLPPDSYDRRAVEQVSACLGHRRLDVVLRHYLR